MDKDGKDGFLWPTDAVYASAGCDDSREKPVDYFDQRVQNHTINQLLKKQSRKKISNFIIRACVFTVFLCSSDDITTCAALVRQYGPGVFLPILVCAICIGMPLMYLEMGLGQFTSSNPIAIFSNIAPIGAGIGWTMVIISVLDVFRQAHLSTIFAHILYKSMQPLFASDFYMTRCLFPYGTDCIDPHVRCAGIGSSYYSRQELQTTTMKSKFYLTSKEENSQCVSNMQVKYATRGLTATRLSQSSGIERYIDLFLTNIGHNPDLSKGPPTAAMDYNIVGLCILTAVMLMAYYDITFIEAIGVFGSIIILINLGFNYYFMAKSTTIIYNNFVMGPGGNLNSVNMWIDSLNYVLMAMQVGQAAHMTLASSNSFSNNCFRDAIIIAVIVTVVPYTAACFLTSNWEKFIVSQMSDMEDRQQYWTGGGLDTGLKNTRNTVHITATAIFGEDQLSAIFLMMAYFLASTTIRMLISFRALVRTFQEQFSAQLAITWQDVCKIFTCIYLCFFMLANTGWMRLALDAIRVGSVRAMPVIVLCYLVVVMFCYGIRRTFLDLNTMLFMNDKSREKAMTAAEKHKLAHESPESSRGVMKRYSHLINVFIGVSWSLMLFFAVVLTYHSWKFEMREGDLYSVHDYENASIATAITCFSLLLLAPMILIGGCRLVKYVHEAFNGTLTISFLFNPNASYGPKDDRHRFIVANETNSVRM